VSDAEGAGDAGDRQVFPEFNAGTARRLLGELLRAARAGGGLTPDRAAALAGTSSATVSGLESGLLQPQGQDVLALVDAYRGRNPEAVPDEVRERIDGLLGEAVRATWQSSFTDHSGKASFDHMRRYAQAEESALHISSYESDLIPGILQTERYAVAVTDLHFPECTVEERRELVATRLGRRAKLFRPDSPPRVHVILAEAVLQRPLFTADVMREQFEDLAATSRRGLGNLTIQLCPLAAQGLGVVGGPFVLMRFERGVAEDFVYLEGRSGAEILEAPRDVQRYQTTFDELVDASIDGQGVLDAIENAIGHL
jgi:transcriptional regulator with XRE-family HTH domain